MEITGELLKKFVEITKREMEAKEKTAAEHCVWNCVEDIPEGWSIACMYTKCEYCPGYQSK